MAQEHPLTPNINRQEQGYKFSAEERLVRQELFCEAFQQTLCNVSAACEAAKITYDTYDWWEKHDSNFQGMLTIARKKAQDSLRGVVLNRAVQGVKELVIQGKEIVRDENGEPIYRTIYDNRVLMRLAAAHLPEFKELVKLQGRGATNEQEPLNLQHYFIVPKANLTTEEYQFLEQLAPKLLARERARQEAIESD